MNIKEKNNSDYFISYFISPLLVSFPPAYKLPWSTGGATVMSPWRLHVYNLKKPALPPCHQRSVPALWSSLWPSSASTPTAVCPSWAEGLRPGHSATDKASQWKSREDSITSYSLLAASLLKKPRILLAFWAARAHSWLMPSFLCIRTPKSISAELLSRSSSPILYLYLGLPQPKRNTVHLALLNLIQLWWVLFSSLSRSPWMATLPSIVSTAPHRLVSSANLLVARMMPLSISLIRMLKSTSPKTVPRGHQLITSLCLRDVGSLTAREDQDPSSKSLFWSL